MTGKTCVTNHFSNEKHVYIV